MNNKKRRIISLTITNQCNLNCIYCYEHNKNDNIMDYKKAIEIISNEFNKQNDDFEELEFQFHGGEPFFEFKNIKKVCEYFWREKQPKNYIFYATTNGTLITSKIKKWLYKNKNKFVCGLSLDGDKPSTNINRSNSFDLIDIDFFTKTWPNQGIKMTISDKTLNNLYDDIIFFHNKSIKFSCNLAYGINWNKEEYINILENELIKLTDYYLNNPSTEPCSLLNYNLANIFSDEAKRFCGSKKFITSYDVLGNSFPCHMFINNVTKNIIDIDSLDKQFENFSGVLNENCKNCCIEKICPICYGNSYINFGSISTRDERYCKLIKLSVLATANLIFRKVVKYEIDQIKDINKKKLEAILLIQESIFIT